jgi:hypothetical protein
MAGVYMWKVEELEDVWMPVYFTADGFETGPVQEGNECP